MQTYLPYADYGETAEVLDDKRLGRQRADVVQILKTLEAPPAEVEGEEVLHPAERMWQGNELQLIQYGVAICSEWASRGNPDNTLSKIMDFLPKFVGKSSKEKPEWLGRPDFHLAHQSHLLRLKPSWYRDKFPNVSDDISMVWPRSPQKQKLTPERRRLEKTKTRWEKAYKAQLLARLDFIEVCMETDIDPSTLEPFNSEQDRDMVLAELQMIMDDQEVAD